MTGTEGAEEEAGLIGQDDDDRKRHEDERSLKPSGIIGHEEPERRRQVHKCAEEGDGQGRGCKVQDKRCRGTEDNMTRAWTKGREREEGGAYQPGRTRRCG